ncbi:Bax inhibitor-1 family protein [Ligilactobacillus sp. LYQ60]|uniref:Bax inhibitor-1 family protein n=1 Tax=Ligilactobacillus sp. LYQ60 TaxID=3378799 RepID=UPI003851C7CD
METANAKKRSDGLSIFFIEIYGLFTLALIVSCMASWLTVRYYNGFDNLINKSPLLSLLAIIGVVFFSSGLHYGKERSCIIGVSLLLACSFCTGVVFSYCSFKYTNINITIAFLSACIEFTVCTILGLIKQDLSDYTPQLIAMLISSLVVTIINLVLENRLIDLVLSFIGIGVYGFLSMYEVNMLKNNYLKYRDSVRRGWIVSVAAMDLFYAFVNIFLNILSILDPDAENDD